MGFKMNPQKLTWSELSEADSIELSSNLDWAIIPFPWVVSMAILRVVLIPHISPLSTVNPNLKGSCD